MLRMRVSHGAICGGKERRENWLKKNERQSVKFSDTLEVTGKKMSGNHCYTLADPCRAAPTNSMSHVTVNRATSSVSLLFLRLENPDRIKTKESPLHKLWEGS